MAASVNNPQGTFGDNVSTLTLPNYLVGSGAKVLVLLPSTQNFGGDITISAVQAMFGDVTSEATQRIANVVETSNFYRTEIWTVENPTEATASVVATLSGASEGVTLQAAWLGGVKAQAPEATSSEDDTTDPADVAATSLTPDGMIVVGMAGRPTTSFTAASPTIEDDVQTTADFSDQGLLGHATASATGSYTVGWSGGIAEGCALVAAVFEQLSGTTYERGIEEATGLALDPGSLLTLQKAATEALGLSGGFGRAESQTFQRSLVAALGLNLSLSGAFSKFWNRISEDPDTWTGIDEAEDSWTAITENLLTWERLSETGTTWALLEYGGDTWTQIAELEATWARLSEDSDTWNTITEVTDQWEQSSASGTDTWTS